MRVRYVQAIDGLACLVQAAAAVVFLRNLNCIGFELVGIRSALAWPTSCKQQHNAEPQSDPGAQKIESVVGAMCRGGACGLEWRR